MDSITHQIAPVQAGREQRLKAIVENTPECIKLVAQDGTVLEMNEAGLKLVEASDAREVIGKCVYDLIAPEYRAAFRKMNEEVCAGSKAYLEFQIVGLRGTRRWMESRSTPVPDTASGRFLHLALTREISEYKRVEEANARLAAIVEHSDDAIISKDLNGIIQSWNRSAERLFGYTAQEAIGRSVMMLIPSNRDNEEPTILSRIRAGQTVDHYETVRRRKDGTLLDISLTVSPVRNPRGEIIGASKIARDITERKRVEAALRRSETLFRELANSMPQMVWAARPDGYVDYYNDRWYEYTGLPQGVFGEESWRPLLHPDDAQRSVEAYSQCVRSLEPYQIEYRLHDRRSGGYRWFLGRALPIRDDAGQVIRWFGTCTDIDDQKRAEERLEKAVAERTSSLTEAIAQMEEFSYTVSHDLRAPLRGMQAYSEVLLHDFAGALPAEAAQYLRRIAANASRLDKMILDVLTFSRVARTDIRLERVDLDRLVRHIVEQYPAMQAPLADIRIEPLPEVLGHEPSLTQAISNLLNNAIKFVAPEIRPQVRVWCEPKGDRIRLFVHDNGIGIAPKYHHRLFRMFERVHPNLKYEGTGVGLAIIRKAIERMGGRVGLESDGVHGSQFWLELSPVPDSAKRGLSSA